MSAVKVVERHACERRTTHRIGPGRVACRGVQNHLLEAVRRPHTLLQPVDAMLPLKQMILPLVVFDMKKVEPIFLDGGGPPRLGISGPREGRLAEPLPHRIYLCCPRVAVAAQRKPGAAPNASVAGLWEGTAVNHYSFLQMERTRCHAVVNITLTMIQK